LLRDWPITVRGHALNGGHYLAEELPDETVAQLKEFFV